MELRFNHVCSKCGERLDVVGREMSKYEDELTIMIKPHDCLTPEEIDEIGNMAIDPVSLHLASSQPESHLG
jgi:hypothetical protein